MPYKDQRKQNRKRKADRRVDVNRLGGQRPSGPATQPSIARPGAFAGQPNIRLEGGGLGGQARIPDSLPAKQSTAEPQNAVNDSPRLPDMRGMTAPYGFPFNKGGLSNVGRGTDPSITKPHGGPLQHLVTGAQDLIRGAVNMGSELNQARKSMSDQTNSRMGENLKNNMLRGYDPSDSTREGRMGNDLLRSMMTPEAKARLDSQVAPSQVDGVTKPDQAVDIDSFIASELKGLGGAAPSDQPVIKLPAERPSTFPSPAPEPAQASSNMNSAEMRDFLTKPNLTPSQMAEEEAKREELSGIQQRTQAARDEIADINAERERLNPMFDSSDPFNMANAAGPRMPTTAEGDLARRSRQAAAGIGDPLSAAEQSQLSEFRARSYAAANGLPYIPPSAPRRPQTSRRSLPDIKAGELETNGEGLQVRSTVNRVTTPDGRQVTFGQGNGQGSRMAVENGNIMMTDTDGTRRAVVLPSSGYSLGLRTAEVDSQGNFIPGTFRTQSDEARRKERQDLAIAKGNAPGATPEEKVAGKQAQEAQDKYSAYKERMRQRRSDALDLRRDANAMRGYGKIGEQFMGYDALGNRMVQPIFGQTGPSLGQAAGMVRQQRDAQERMDKAMKQKQEEDMAKRRQDILLEAYKANPNDPRLQDAFSKDLGLRDRTPEEQSRYDRDQFNLKIGQMTENNELTMDPRQIPGAGVGDLDPETRSKLAAGIDDVLKSDLLSDEDRMQLFRNVDLDVMRELIDGTAWDKKYWDGERSEKLYKDFEAYLKRTDQFEEQAPPKLETPPSLRRPVAGPLI